MPTEDHTMARIDDAPDAAAAAATPPAPIEPSHPLAADPLGSPARGPDPAADVPGLPRLPAPAPEAAAPAESDWPRVRRFHAGHPGAGDELETPDDGMLPALLHPYRDPRRVRHDYPLVLVPSGAEGDGPPALPLSDFLARLAATIAPAPDDARILKDNLARLERHVRAALADDVESAGVGPCLQRAAAAMEEALALRGDSARMLHEELARLLEQVPGGASLLVLDEQAPVRLFMHLARTRAAARRAALKKDASELGARLRDLLRLDDVKHAGTDQPEGMAATVGTAADHYLDPDALAKLLKRTRGSAPMDAARRDRIEHVLQIFKEFNPEDQPLVIVIHPGDAAIPVATPDLVSHPAAPAHVGRAATEVFDETAATFARLFGALRVARLELDDAYEPARHDMLQEVFDWRAFGRDELLDLPPVLALESAAHAGGAGMPELSRLLLSARPINVLIAVDPAANPGDPEDHDPLAGFRIELGYLGISHREAMVHQSSAARPRHLLDGFARSLDSACASMHVVASESARCAGPPATWSWLHEGAALEGRAHPFFHYNPELGQTWARRLDFADNPQPESDWPTYDMPCLDADGEQATMTLSFTFADFALLEPAFRPHFRVVPGGLESDALVAITDYLARPAEESVDLVPYLWAVDDQDQLHRIVISRTLAFACGDRLAYWHTLQELAGVRNEYVREAVSREQGRLEAEFMARQQQVDEAHAAEVERVRTESARDAMRALARALLQSDSGAIAAAAAEVRAVAPPPVTEAPPAPPEAAVAEPAPVEAAPEPSEPEEPWIESALCTSCNDCLDINPRLFVYNANKQAVISDPQAGTFDELVRAAEKCPARCIHPGTPMNPDEPNLEALIERARPFE
ncbi:MAG: ferredoxin [Planctomycetota bacterium]|jgi:ferredoxin